jgi:hypothetical protein
VVGFVWLETLAITLPISASTVCRKQILEYKSQTPKWRGKTCVGMYTYLFINFFQNDFIPFRSLRRLLSNRAAYSLRTLFERGISKCCVSTKVRQSKWKLKANIW